MSAILVIANDRGITWETICRLQTKGSASSSILSLLSLLIGRDYCWQMAAKNPSVG